MSNFGEQRSNKFLETKQINNKVTHSNSYSVTVTVLQSQFYSYSFTVTVLQLQYYSYSITVTVLQLQFYHYSVTVTVLQLQCNSYSVTVTVLQLQFYHHIVIVPQCHRGTVSQTLCHRPSNCVTVRV